MTVQRIDFNPRTRVGYDSVTFETPAYTDWISIHVPAWGTTQNGDEDRHYRSISIHVPAWGTTDQGLHFDRILQFQSTYPRGVRHYPLNSCHSIDKFQSTYPRGVRLPRPGCRAWDRYFNPRTRVGYDFNYFFSSCRRVNFNPRTRVGYDCKLSDHSYYGTNR